MSSALAITVMCIGGRQATLFCFVNKRLCETRIVRNRTFNAKPRTSGAARGASGVYRVGCYMRTDTIYRISGLGGGALGDRAHREQSRCSFGQDLK